MKKFNFTELSQLIATIKSSILQDYQDLSAGHHTGIAFEFEAGNKEMITREVLIDNEGLYYRKDSFGFNLKLKISVETLVEVLNGNVTPLGKVA
jgi:hypothetical protein